MNSSKYRYMLWQFIAASDMARYDTVTAEEVHAHADARTIRPFLTRCFGADLDFSLLDSEDWAAVTETWANIANAVSAARKFGVENRGVSLLMAYALQGLQQSES